MENPGGLVDAINQCAAPDGRVGGIDIIQTILKKAKDRPRAERGLSR
jgi:hypothetical protein